MRSKIWAGVGSTKEWVYFIRASNGYIKIGRSCNPESRLKALQAASPLPLTLMKSIGPWDKRHTVGASWAESHLHQMFAGIRLHGEWFGPSSLLEDFVHSVSELRPSRGDVLLHWRRWGTGSAA